MRVGYFHFYGLGDNIFAFRALYALKHIYGCELIVFGNANMCMLLQYCDFVDLAIDINGDIANNIERINEFELDYAVLTNCKRRYLRPLEATNAKTIITITKPSSLLSMRCKTIPLLYLPKYRRMNRLDQSLLYVRRINPSLFDSKIQSLCLDNAKIKSHQSHKERVCKAIANYIQQIGEGEYRLILLNPFSQTATHTLPLDDYLQIASIISAMPQYIVVIATYPGVHADFLQALNKWQEQHGTFALMIFENDNDIMNLVALIEQMNCVISPSTGTIHLASNLCIPTIGLFSEFDILKWETRSKQYVRLQTPRDSMSVQERQQAIQETITLLSDMLA